MKKTFYLLLLLIISNNFVNAQNTSTLWLWSTIIPTNVTLQSMNTYIWYCNNQTDELNKDIWYQSYYESQSTQPLFVRWYRRWGYENNRDSLISWTKIYTYSLNNITTNVNYKVKSNLNPWTSLDNDNWLNAVFSVQALNPIVFRESQHNRSQKVWSIALNWHYQQFKKWNTINNSSNYFLWYSTSSDISSDPIFENYNRWELWPIQSNLYSCRVYYIARCGDWVLDKPEVSEQCRDRVDNSTNSIELFDGMASVSNGCVNWKHWIQTNDWFVLWKNTSFQQEQCDLWNQNWQPWSSCSSTCQNVVTPTCDLKVSINWQQVLSAVWQGAWEFYDTQNNPNNRYEIQKNTTVNITCNTNRNWSTLSLFFGTWINIPTFANAYNAMGRMLQFDSPYNTTWDYDTVWQSRIMCGWVWWNMCNAYIRVKDTPIQPLCGSLDGRSIYDLDDAGNASSLFGTYTSDWIDWLCQVWTPSTISFNSTTHTRSWTCNGSAGTTPDECSATEQFCGNWNLNQNPNPTLQFTGSIPRDMIMQNMTYIEHCDDGNRTNWDWCDNFCRLETPSCSGTMTTGWVVYRYPWSLINIWQWENVTRNIDHNGTNNDRVYVNNYYFENLPALALNPPMQVSYLTSHIYDDLWNFVYWFQLTNNISNINTSITRPSVRCTGQIQVSEPSTPDIRIQKEQRTWNNSWTESQISLISGNTLGYRITVHNDWNATANDIIITDHLDLTRFLPSGWTTGSDCANTRTILTTNSWRLTWVNIWNMSGLNADSTCSIIITGTIIRDNFTNSTPPICIDQYKNIATGNYQWNITTWQVIADILTGNIAIYKFFSGTSMPIWTTWYFDIVVQNTWLGNIYNIRLNDIVTWIFQNIWLISQNPNIANIQLIWTSQNTISGYISNLAPNQTWTWRFSFFVPMDISLSGLIVWNTWTLNIPCYPYFVWDGNILTWYDEILLTHNPSQISIIKYQSGSRIPSTNWTTGDILIKSGDLVSYRLDITNTGWSTADDIQINEDLPMHFSWLRRETGSNCANWQNVSVIFDTRWDPIRDMDWLQPNKTCSIYIYWIFTNDDILSYPTCNQRFVNNANLYQNNNLIWLGTIYGQVLTGNIQISKVFLDDEYPVWGTGRFQITITNNGPGNMHNISLIDQLSGVLKYANMVQWFVPSGNPNLNSRWAQLVWSNIDIMAGETWTGIVEFDITWDLNLIWTQICNTSKLEWCFVDWKQDSDCFLAIEPPLGILEVEKSQRDFTVCDENNNGALDMEEESDCPWNYDTIYTADGHILTYRIWYRNTWTDTISEFRIEDWLGDDNFVMWWWTADPDILTYSISWYPNENNHIRSWTNLEPWQSWYIYITGTFVSRANGDNEAHNTAIWYANDLSDTSNEVIAILPLLSIYKYQYNMSWLDSMPPDPSWTESPISVFSGNNFWYRIVYQNKTSTDISNVIIRENIPQWFDFDLAHIYETPNINGNVGTNNYPTNNPTWNSNERNLTWYIPSLSAGQSWEIIITWTIDWTQSSHRNRVWISWEAGWYQLTWYDDTLAYLNNAHLDKRQRNRSRNPNGTYTSDTIVVQSGDVVEYIIEFANPTVNTVNANITDWFPSWFVVSSCFYSNDPNNIIWQNPCMWNVVYNQSNGRQVFGPRVFELAPGMTWYIYFSWTINDADIYNTRTNVVAMESCNAQDPSQCTQWTDEVVAILASFDVEKHLIEFVEWQRATFEICATNYGVENMTNYQISDYLQNVFEFVQGSARYEVWSGWVQSISNWTLWNPVWVAQDGSKKYSRQCDMIWWSANNIPIIPASSLWCPLAPNNRICITFDARPKR